MKLFGIDISEHNGNVDMKKIKNSGVKFAIIRASWGHFQEDKQLRNNVKKCNDVGMNYGLYHYSYARNDAEAKQEAENFLALAKQFSGRSYPLVLDMEDADGWKKEQGVSMEQEVRTIRIWKEIIEGAGQYLMLYCNKDWWNKLRAIDAKLIDSIDLWLAHWGISEPSVNCGIWQYSSDGKVNGSSVRTDVNYAYKDYPSLIKGSSSKPSEPAKPSKPSKPNTKYKVGDTVNINGIYVSKDSKEKLKPAVSSGKITKIYAGANNPYLIGNGTGFVNDACITGKKGSTSSKTLKVGMKAKPKKAVSYDGVKLDSFVTKKYFKVIEVEKKRVVLGDGINTAFNIDNLIY